MDQVGRGSNQGSAPKFFDVLSTEKTSKKECQWGDSNPRPALHEVQALPLRHFVVCCTLLSFLLFYLVLRCGPSGSTRLPRGQVAARDWPSSIAPVAICPFNLQLKFVTSITRSYGIQIRWVFFLNFSKITLLLIMTLSSTYSIYQILFLYLTLFDLNRY